MRTGNEKVRKDLLEKKNFSNSYQKYITLPSFDIIEKYNKKKLERDKLHKSLGPIDLPNDIINKYIKQRKEKSLSPSKPMLPDGMDSEAISPIENKFRFPIETQGNPERISNLHEKYKNLESKSNSGIIQPSYPSQRKELIPQNLIDQYRPSNPSMPQEQEMMDEMRSERPKDLEYKRSILLPSSNPVKKETLEKPNIAQMYKKEEDRIKLQEALKYTLQYFIKSYPKSGFSELSEEEVPKLFEIATSILEEDKSLNEGDEGKALKKALELMKGEK